MTNVNNIRNYFFKGVLWIKLWITSLTITLRVRVQKETKDKDKYKVKA